MTKKELEYLNQLLTKLFESLGSPYSAEEEQTRWLKNYKNTNPKFRLYNFDEAKFEDRLKQLPQHIPEFQDLTDKEMAQFYAYAFNSSPYYSIGHAAINHFKKQQRKNNPNLIEHWPLLKTWVNRIDCWSHADMIASLYCDMLSENPKEVLPELEKWVLSNNPWKNRMAIVSLLYYYNPKRYLPKFTVIKKFLDLHLEKDHYYLQKAIGWCLRETSRAYPKEFKVYMDRNIELISSTAFSSAVEKTESSLKENWKHVRKAQRK